MGLRSINFEIGSMLVQVVSGFPPHLSVHSELPGSWKYSPILGLVGAVDTTGGADDVEVGEGFACDQLRLDEISPIIIRDRISEYPTHDYTVTAL